MSGIQVKNHTSDPIQAGNISLQPISQSIHFIGKHFGFAWNRPVAVQVDDGRAVYQLPIRDRTRLILVYLWGLTAAFSLIALSSKSKKRSKS
ncbi:MAG TPA: hypothetical protein DCY42_07265 [Chloroflexi bacterium]|nr:hypothetical protein [Chloroflexota bacterium]